MEHVKLFEDFLNESEVTSLSDMFSELSTWIEFTDEEKEEANKSGIDTSNNSGFARLVKDWSFGKYDEEPEFVANELRQFAKNKNWQYNP